MKRLLIAEQWNSYVQNVLPKEVSLTQKIETRRAFYAGAQCLLHSIMNVLDPESEPTDNDLKTMDNLEQELSDFAVMIKEGKA